MGFVLAIIIFCIVVIGIGYLIYNYSDVDFDLKEKKIEIQLKEDLYQGPVPEGYDEDHFRKTGETIKQNG